MSEFLSNIFNFLFTSYIGAFLFIFYGLLYVYFQNKRKQNINDWFFLRGWFSGVGFLILGILIIILKLLDKL